MSQIGEYTLREAGPDEDPSCLEGYVAQCAETITLHLLLLPFVDALFACTFVLVALEVCMRQTSSRVPCITFCSYNICSAT